MSSDGLDRALGLAGAVGGLVWAGIPVVGALAFYGVEAGAVGLSSLGPPGALFQFAGLSVVGMLAGTVGLYRRFPATAERWGRRGAVIAGAGFVLLLPGSLFPSGRLPSDVAQLVPLVFFAGLLAVAIGSLGAGLAARRSGAWPAGLAAGFGLAMPVGAAVGGLLAQSGGGNLAFVLGLVVPYGIAWIALGGAIAARRV
ncbi:MAG: hypothetical protein U5J98_08675 [Halobacteriales archaeon]|nr:hypothetical protein [Halobacteriales archaeon]